MGAWTVDCVLWTLDSGLWTLDAHDAEDFYVAIVAVAWTIIVESVVLHWYSPLLA